jgi:hypothetical protein
MLGKLLATVIGDLPLGLGLFAQTVSTGPWGWGWANLATGIVIVAGIAAALWIGLRHLGIQIPQIAVQLFWVVVIVFFVVLAIKVIASM